MASIKQSRIVTEEKGEDDFADKLLSAMRFQFGGHAEQRSTKIS